MKLEQARSGILDLWIAERSSVNQGEYTSFFQKVRKFYERIMCSHAELLKFNYLGDKWQVINRWIQEYEDDFRLGN